MRYGVSLGPTSLEILQLNGKNTVNRKPLQNQRKTTFPVIVGMLQLTNRNVQALLY